MAKFYDSTITPGNSANGVNFVSATNAGSDIRLVYNKKTPIGSTINHVYFNAPLTDLSIELIVDSVYDEDVMEVINKNQSNEC